MLFTVVKLKQLGKNLDLVQSKVLQLPLDSLPANAEKMMQELQKPLTVSSSRPAAASR